MNSTSVKACFIASAALALTGAFSACGGLNSGQIIIVDEPSGGSSGKGNANAGEGGLAGSDMSDGGEGGQIDEPPSVEGPPTVISVSPEDKADGANPALPVVITFSEPLRAATVNADSVQVKDETGAIVAGKLAYQAAVVTFTPARRFALTEAYTVTVSTAVKDSDGETLDRAFNAAFTVRAGAWSTANELTATGAKVEASARIAGDRNGHALAVWTQASPEVPAAHDVVGRLFTQGKGWGALITIDKGAEDATLPSVSMNAVGDAVVAWVEAGAHCRARRYTGGVWEDSAVQIDDPAQPASSIPGVVAGISLTGGTLVAWLQTHTSGGASDQYLYARRAPRAASWAAPSTLSQDKEGNLVSLPALALEDNGDAYAAYQATSYPSQYLVVNYLNASTGFWTPEPITESEAMSVTGISIAADGTGKAMVVWLRGMVEGKLADVAAMQLGATFSKPFPLGSYTATPPAVVWTGKKFVAMWTSDFNLYTNQFEIDWNAPATVSGTEKDVADFALAADTRGNALAVWSHSAATKELSYIRLNGVRGQWSPPASAAVADSARAFPVLAMQPDGTAVGAWSSVTTNPLGFKVTDRIEQSVFE